MYPCIACHQATTADARFAANVVPRWQPSSTLGPNAGVRPMRRRSSRPLPGRWKAASAGAATRLPSSTTWKAASPSTATSH